MTVDENDTILHGTCRGDGAGINTQCGEKIYKMDAADPPPWVQDDKHVAKASLDGLPVVDLVVVVPAF
jgi:hypothetical protein